MVDSKKERSEVLHSFRTRILAILVLAVFCAGTVFATVSQSYTVTVYVDDVPYAVSTTSVDAKEIVTEAGFTIESSDVLNLDKFGDNEPIIKLYKEHTVTVIGNDAKPKEVTIAGTVEDAVKAAGFAVEDGESLNVPLHAALKEGMEIFFLRNLNITFVVDGQTKTEKIAVATVAQAIEQAGITLGKDDEVKPALNESITKDMTITVYRVTYGERTVNETVAYKTTLEKTATMYTDESVMVSKGSNGERTVTYQDKYIDGKLTSSKETESTIITAPVNAVKRVGTKVRYNNITLRTNNVISELGTPDWINFDANDLPINYKKVVEGRAAAYTGGGITSTGKAAKPGYIAVDPREIPYGTKMWIVSLDGNYVYGYAIAADTGGFIYQDRFICDLYMHTESACIQWGARMVRIYIF